MIYKAKESYFKLKDDENFNAFSDPAKHNKLMASRSIEITEPPKSLIKHLQSAEFKKKLKEDK
tara:strand:- start:127 stop:315 length:189 start_codon:yes stop_codon:yes gene_type:complete